jgi:hypothetical protein
MKPEKLSEALQVCAKMLETPGYIYVLHRARIFGEFAGNPLVLQDFSKPSKLLDYLFIDQNIEPSRIPESMRERFFPDEVKAHVVWMSHQIRQLGSPNKSCRWIGFAAGALAFYGLGRPQSNLVDVMDLSILQKVASNKSSPHHHVAHLALGYMQGWLWAAGMGSINDFRLMNNPEAMVA